MATLLLPDNDRGRPPAKEAASNVITDGDNPSVARSTDLLADLDALAEHLRGRFVVQVTVDAERGHKRTNVYRSCAAAERAVARAKARGQSAHVSLVQMLPVGVVSGVVR